MTTSLPVKGRFSLNGHTSGNGRSGRRLTADRVFQTLVNNYLAYAPRTWGRNVNLLDQDGQRDLDKEFHYPVVLNMPVYRQLYFRNGIARKLVRVYPDECAAVKADIYETERDQQTPWERRFAEVRHRFRLDSMVHRVDVQSGIGSYGGLLVRTNDGRNLRQAPAGVNADGTKGTRRSTKRREVVFIRPLAQDHCKVAKVEKDDRNPRYGLPTEYEVDLDSLDPETGMKVSDVTGDLDDDTSAGNKVRVHWSRIVHVPSDGLEESEWYGTPRLMPVANTVWDLRKVLGSAAEMWFRGAFMGISFETTGTGAEYYDVDMDDLKDEIEAFQHGFQRFLRLVNMKANPLAPQIEDPTNHAKQLLNILAAVTGIPLPILMGSEVGKADGGQNITAWNRRLILRNHDHVEPYIWRPLIDRLTLLDVLPETRNPVFVTWRDLHTQTEKDRADVALKLTQALLQYVTSGAFNLVSPRQFFTNVLKFTDDVANAMITEAGGEKKLLAKLSSLVKADAGLTPGTSGTNPARRTNASGQRNATGRGRSPRRAN